MVNGTIPQVMKKNLLIISPSMPQINTNAGDWRVCSLVCGLSKYFNIFFMPLKSCGCGGKYLENLQNVTVLKKIADKDKFSDFINKHKIETLIIEKYWDIPFDALEYMPLVKKSVVDVHEIGFKKTDAQSKIEKIGNNKLYKAKELLFYRQADILIAISGEEQKELRKYFPDKKIILLPTCTEVKTTDKSFFERKDICYFGFFGHRPNAEAVNFFIKNNLKTLLNINPGIKFYVLGKGAHMFKKVHKNVITKEKIKDINCELSKYRVFVCPLGYGAGIKKKVLDAMASKTPVVATKYGYEGIKGTGKYAVERANSDFAYGIISLYNNKNLWKKNSQINYKTVKMFYSQHAFKKYVKKLSDIL